MYLNQTFSVISQTRILTYGISGAVIFRATMILLGVATIQVKSI